MPTDTSAPTRVSGTNAHTGLLQNIQILNSVRLHIPVSPNDTKIIEFADKREHGPHDVKVMWKHSGFGRRISDIISGHN